MKKAGRTPKYNKTEQIRIVEEWRNGDESVLEISQRYNISVSTMENYIKSWKTEKKSIKTH